MSLLKVKPWHIAPRIAAGVMILNAGANKRGADPDTAKGLHGMAAAAYPVVDDVEPEAFVDGLSKAEVALGTALVVPVVPTGPVAAALTAFSAGLLGLYARVPGLREPRSVRPTQAGNAVAKDVWLLGIGLGLLTETLFRRGRG